MKPQAGSRPRRRKQEEEDDLPASSWLDSYADMISLLFALFIVLYGMSKINEESFRQLAEALSKSLSTGGVATAQEHQNLAKSNIMRGEIEGRNQRKLGDDVDKDKSSKHKNRGKELPPDLKKIEKELSLALKKKGMGKVARVFMEERGLVVSLITDKLLFEIGEAQLKPKCKEILDVLAPILKKTPTPLRIEGHTCDLPIRTSRFRSNWELSTMRATNVAWYLITARKIEPDRVSIIGYGEYRPLFENDGEKSRRKNRRVDIIILNSKSTVMQVAKKKDDDKKKKKKGGAGVVGEQESIWEIFGSE